MMALNLPPDLDADLTVLAARTGKPKAFHIELALSEYLEDLADHALAEEAMRDYDPSQNVSHEQLKRELGLED